MDREKNHGTGKPASAETFPGQLLVPCHDALSVEFHGNPRICATRAAITVGRSPTAIRPFNRPIHRRLDDGGD